MRHAVCPHKEQPSTLPRWSQQRNRRKPHQQERCAPPTFLLCFLKSVGLRFTYANTRGKSAGFRRGMMLPANFRSLGDFGSLRVNPYPVHYRPAFACSLLLYPPSPRLPLRFAFLSCHQFRETTGLPRSVAVTVWVRSRLSAGGTTTAPEEFGASGPDHVPFGPSVSASCAWPL